MNDTPATETPQAKSEYRFIFISIGVLVLLLVISSFFIDMKQVVAVIIQANWLMVAAGTILFLLGIVLIDYRWWRLLSRVPAFRRLIHATHVSFIVPILSPIPNIPIRVITTGVATKATIPQATTAIMVERMIAQIMRIIAIILAILLGAQADVSPSSLLKSFGIAVGILAIFLLAVRYYEKVVSWTDAILRKMPFIKESWREKIVTMVYEALAYGGDMRQLILTTGITLVMWMLFFFFHLLVIMALPLNLTLQTQLTIAMGALALTPPSAPAMLGIYHASMIIPMMALNLAPLDALLPFSLLLWGIQAVVWMILTFWGLSKLNMRFADLFRISQEFETEQSGDEPVVQAEINDPN
jgi:uncharacterized membrane protein YbhN (UPF0104 family)